MSQKTEQEIIDNLRKQLEDKDEQIAKLKNQNNACVATPDGNIAMVTPNNDGKIAIGTPDNDVATPNNNHDIDDDNENENHRPSCNPCSCKIAMAIYIFAWAVSSYGIYRGIKDLTIGSEWISESTKETCLLHEYTAITCSYDCGSSESAQTCYDIGYNYKGTVHDKCGNQTLNSYVENDDCPEKLKNMEEEYSCWVLDCEDAEFRFDHPDNTVISGYGFTIFASLFAASPFVHLGYKWGRYLLRSKK